MSKHTPGPWGYDEIDRVVVKESVIDIAHMDRTASDADAHLIVAAPDLLEALKAASNYIDTLGGISKSYRAVIAKATGEAP